MYSVSVMWEGTQKNERDLKIHQTKMKCSQTTYSHKEIANIRGDHQRLKKAFREATEEKPAFTEILDNLRIRIK